MMAQIPPGSKRIQFGLSSILVFMAVSGVLLAGVKTLDLGAGLAFFSIGFYALFMLILGLMRIRRRGYVVVFVSGDESAAHMLCDFLNRHGMSAAIQRDSFAFPGMGLQPNRVLVPAHEADEAIRLLEAHWRNQEGPGRARD